MSKYQRYEKKRQGNRVYLTLTPEQRQRLKEAAKTTGEPAATYARRIVLAAVNGNDAATPELVAEVRALFVLLKRQTTLANQAMAKAHALSGHGVDVRGELKEVLNRSRFFLDQLQDFLSRHKP